MYIYNEHLNNTIKCQIYRYTFFLYKVSLCHPFWPQIYYGSLVVLELTEVYFPLTPWCWEHYA